MIKREVLNKSARLASQLPVKLLTRRLALWAPGGGGGALSCSLETHSVLEAAHRPPDLGSWFLSSEGSSGKKGRSKYE